jgi:hypothetical protein
MDEAEQESVKAVDEKLFGVSLGLVPFAKGDRGSKDVPRLRERWSRRRALPSDFTGTRTFSGIGEAGDDVFEGAHATTGYKMEPEKWAWAADSTADRGENGL